MMETYYFYIIRLCHTNTVCRPPIAHDAPPTRLMLPNLACPPAALDSRSPAINSNTHRAPVVAAV